MTVQGQVPASHKLSSTFCEQTPCCGLMSDVTCWVVCQTDLIFVTNRNFMMPVIKWDPSYSDWPVQPQKMVMKDLVRWKAVKSYDILFQMLHWQTLMQILTFCSWYSQGEWWSVKSFRVLPKDFWNAAPCLTHYNWSSLHSSNTNSSGRDWGRCRSWCRS